MIFFYEGKTNYWSSNTYRNISSLFLSLSLARGRLTAYLSHSVTYREEGSQGRYNCAYAKEMDAA